MSMNYEFIGTLGPWRAVQSEGDKRWSVVQPQKGWSFGQVYIVEEMGQRETDTEEPDAHLIAAAPELLEECKKSMTVYERMSEGLDWLERNHSNLPLGHSIEAWIENFKSVLDYRIVANKKAIHKALNIK